MHKRFGIRGSVPDWGSFITFFKDRLWKLISISVLKILTCNLVCIQSKPSGIKYCTVFVVRPEMTKYGLTRTAGGPRIMLKRPKILKSLIISGTGGPRAKITIFSDSPPSTSVTNGCCLSTQSVESPIIAHFDFSPLSQCLTFNNHFVHSFQNYRAIITKFFLWVCNPNRKAKFEIGQNRSKDDVTKKSRNLKKSIYIS